MVPSQHCALTRVLPLQDWPRPRQIPVECGLALCLLDTVNKSFCCFEIGSVYVVLVDLELAV